MAALVTANLYGSFSFGIANAPNSIDSIRRAVGLDPGTVTLGPGTGPNQVNLCYANAITLAASTPQTLDLRALTDADGTTKVFSAVKFLWAWLYAPGGPFATPGPNPLMVGNAAANAWFAPWNAATDVFTIQPGFPWMLANVGSGWPVDATHKGLLLDPGSLPVSLFLAIAGLS